MPSAPISGLPDAATLTNQEYLPMAQPNPSPPNYQTVKTKLLDIKNKIVPTDLADFTNSPGYTPATTPVGTFPNDVGYLTPASLSSVPVSTFPNDVGYLTPASLSSVPVSTFPNDASYATSGFVNSRPVSTFTNDAGYTTSTAVAALPVSTFTNDAGYTTSTAVAALPVSTFTNDAGYITSVSTSTLVCTSTNDDAPAGRLGEYVEGTQVVTSPISVVNNTVTDIISIVLSNGDWDVTGMVFAGTTGIPFDRIEAYISTASATVPGDPFWGVKLASDDTMSYTDDSQWTLPTVRLSLTGGPTTVYLVVFQFNTAASALGMAGRLRARRMR